MVWWTAVLLLVGGPSLALLFRTWGVGSLAFGFGAILLAGLWPFVDGKGRVRSSLQLPTRGDRCVPCPRR